MMDQLVLQRLIDCEISNRELERELQQARCKMVGLTHDLGNAKSKLASVDAEFAKYKEEIKTLKRLNTGMIKSKKALELAVNTACKPMQRKAVFDAYDKRL